MSYDVSLHNPDGSMVQLDHRHQLRGGTYAVGGTTDATLNVTYNYSPILWQVWPKQGLEALEGLTALESISVLTNGMLSIPWEPADEDYWKPTNGNVRAMLGDLLVLACQAPPESRWRMT